MLSGAGGVWATYKLFLHKFAYYLLSRLQEQRMEENWLHHNSFVIIQTWRFME